MTKIIHTNHIERMEPLNSPFGFKGGFLSELWQSICKLEGESREIGIGVGVQSILWSDANVFLNHGEVKGNEIMREMTNYALSLAKEEQYDTPIDLVDRIRPAVYAHGQSLSGMPDLRYTFALNSLVTIDHAAWSLYSHERGQSFEQLIPESYRSVLTARHSELASIPAISYGMSNAEIVDVLDAGYFLLKVKIGADPNQDGDQEKMLEWDKQRISEIHELAQRYSTPHTDSGQIAYYMDANGRYESKDVFMRFLDHADRIGALEHMLLFEEPFPEEFELDVSDVPVRLAGDESVHDEEDAKRRIEMGYGAMALKPVAKTMSTSLKVAKAAMERGIPCFCADLTANPILADWNKNLAARLSPIPGLKCGAIETNGYQNYANWEQMKSWHPRSGASWINAEGGIYRLNEQFYEIDGGALDISTNYSELFRSYR